MNMGLGGHGRWLAFLMAGLIAGLIAGIAITYFVLPRRARAAGIDDALCERAFANTAALNACLAERAAVDPGVGAHPLLGVPEAERDAVWAEYVESTATYAVETVQSFNANFSGESQFLVEQLSAAGFWSEPTDINAINQLALQHLAQELDASALRAGCRR